MPQSWYCLIDGQQLGPLSSRELRALGANQKLLPSHYVRQDPRDQWVPAARVKGLFSKLAPPTRPPTVSRQWIVRVCGREFGPYSDDDIKRFAADGHIQPGQELRLSHLTTWHKTEQLRGLFDSAAEAESAGDPSATGRSVLRFTCPSCARRWRCRVEHAGKTFECPGCGARIVVPKVVRPIEATPADGLDDRRSNTIDIRNRSPSPPPEKTAPNMATLRDLGASSIKRAAKWLQQLPENAQKALLARDKVVPPGRVDAPGSDYRPPPDSIRFYGLGSTVDLGLGLLRDPLVYATGSRLDQVKEASLIELPLAVRFESPTLYRLPYWPTYHDCDPAQRGRYLKWLYDGRSDATTDLGYVFIFFYGLEHRILVDDADHQLVIEEILRLLKIYSGSRSFYGYATSLLWLTIYLAAKRLGADDAVVRRACGQMTRWTEDTLRYCLAYYHRVGKALPPEVAFAVSEHDERSANSVIGKRHPEQLKTLFAARYRQQFPDGFLPRPSRTIKIDYRPASPILLGGRNSASALASGYVPDVLASRGALMMLVDIWTACIEDLREFDRASRQGSHSALTAAAYESLPRELRTEDHPELAAWQAAITETTDDGGWPLMPIGKLAWIKGIMERKKLTKRESESLLATADAIGFCIEPDIRFTGKTYEWNQTVVVFRQCGDNPTAGQIKSFNSASILLQLGLTIAEADGQINEPELKHIAGHLEQHFDLGQRLAKRLDALKHLLARCGATGSGITPRTLKSTLALQQRQLVGEYVVGVAAADRVITPDERNALKKVYRALGVSSDVLDDVLARHEQSHPTAARPTGAAAEAAVASLPVELDLELIRKTRAETTQLQELLNEVLNPDAAELADVQETSEAATGASQFFPVNVDRQVVDGVLVAESATTRRKATEPIGPLVLALSDAPRNYRQFLELLIMRPQWSRGELTSLAREQGVMLNAVVEVLNDWSVDTIEELLIEESGEEMTVHCEYLENC